MHSTPPDDKYQQRAGSFNPAHCGSYSLRFSSIWSSNVKQILLMISAWSLLLTVASAAQAAGGKATTDPKQADADFAIQGEYVGEAGKEGEQHTWGVQVVALGDGKFSAVGYPGGLPGDGWTKEEKKMAEGVREGDKVVFTAADGKVTLTAENGVITLTATDGTGLGELKKVHRKSKTLGAKPPQDAIVLFDGTSTDAWNGGRMTEDGLLMEGVTSKQKFNSFSGHVEFLLPYMPEARGQGRGNSGCYFQGRYEVQMLDSFGLSGEDNECGGLYKISKPAINMCYPPLSWQTYDFDFTAAQYEGDKKVKDATLTVLHNGVEIQKNVKLPHDTTAAPVKEGPGPGPLFLQNHGNPVRYRNIWVVEKK
jgi:hypothetical protein